MIVHSHINQIQTINTFLIPPNQTSALLLTGWPTVCCATFSHFYTCIVYYKNYYTNPLRAVEAWQQRIYRAMWTQHTHTSLQLTLGQRWTHLVCLECPVARGWLPLNLLVLPAFLLGWRPATIRAIHEVAVATETKENNNRLLDTPAEVKENEFTVKPAQGYHCLRV